MNGGLTLPRLLARSRRRKPRGPEWKRTAKWCAAWLVLLALNGVLGHFASAAGCAVFFSLEWRNLHRWPCDPEAAALTMEEARRGCLMAMLGLALMVVGILT